ncbi:MAG TPA: heparinase II/III family protein [Candidatus Methylacidiphilales bacterium]
MPPPPSETSSNLLLGSWTKAKLVRLFRSSPRRPLLPPLGAPEWTAAAANPAARSLLAPLLARARREASRPLPALTDALYTLFHRTGKRLPFERLYFERRRRFARAAIALLTTPPDDPWHGRFARSARAKIEDIFAEPAWALPAHVLVPSGRDPERIDLFCAETANLMAEALDLFEAVLPPTLCGHIRERLRTGIWELHRREPLRQHWERARNNWNAVCFQGVLGSALSQDDDAERLADLALAARAGLPCFLGEYGPDGGTSEGPLYWRYGFGWFSVLNEQLETRTGGRLSLFAGDPHVEEVARFGPRVSLRGGKLVNFADCTPEEILRPSLLSYLGERLREKTCRDLSAINYSRLGRQGLDLDQERCDLFHLGRLLLRFPAKLADEEPSLPDHYFPDLGVSIARGRDRVGHFWDFAAKGGHNDEHHNHNDCGSFLLNIDGIRYLAEIGSPEYDKGFFGPKRYGYLAARTLGHSLPLINGREQAAGRDYASRILSCGLSPARASFKVDLTGCYPPEAACRSLVRSLRLDKRAGVLRLEDRIAMEPGAEVESALVTDLPVRVVRGGARIESDRGVLLVSPLAGTRIARVETHAYSDHDGHPAHIHRIVLHPEKPATSLRLGAAFRFSSCEPK